MGINIDLRTIFVITIIKSMKMNPNGDSDKAALSEFLSPYSIYFKDKTTLDFVTYMFWSYRQKIEVLATNEIELRKLIQDNKKLKAEIREIENVQRIAEIFANENRKTTTSFFNEVIFKGRKKGERIVLNNKGVVLIGSMFRTMAKNKTQSDSEPLVNFSTELSHEWSLFTLYKHLYFESKEKTKRYTLINKTAIQLEIKKNLSNEIHSFLKFATTISKPGKISEEELRLIGKFFVWAGLCDNDEFLINEDYAKIRLWIKRAFINLKPTKTD